MFTIGVIWSSGILECLPLLPVKKFGILLLALNGVFPSYTLELIKCSDNYFKTVTFCPANIIHIDVPIMLCKTSLICVSFIVPHLFV